MSEEPKIINALCGFCEAEREFLFQGYGVTTGLAVYYCSVCGDKYLKRELSVVE